MERIGTVHNLYFSPIQKRNEELHKFLRLCPAEIRQLEQALELYEVDPSAPSSIDHVFIGKQIKVIQERLQRLEQCRQIDPKVLSKLQNRFETFQENYAPIKLKHLETQPAA
jgi:hypothetical protein